MLLIKLGSWLAQKLLVAGLIVLVGLAGYGAWLLLQDAAGMESRRLERLERAVAERERLTAAQAAFAERIGNVQAEITAQRERARQAERILANLRELQSWWERWFGDGEQQAANAERAKRVEALGGEAANRIAALEQLAGQLPEEEEAVQEALRRVELEIAAIEAGRSKVVHYLREAWDRTKWYLALAVGGYFFGPSLWAVLMYYGFAGLVAYGRPIRLGPEPAALPEVGPSRVSVQAILRPGEILRLKEKFLQASDEGVTRHTCFVLDWRIPLTSLACGLIELMELRAATAERDYHVTLSNSTDPHLELALIDVPAGGSIVLRPSFLAGVVQRKGERLRIRRHWRLGHWSAWVTGQFRFFEFVGPCRLIVVGSRGVRAERLAVGQNRPNPARRTNQDSTIAFTPHLRYSSVRAETFWSYYRGMNPLFDDLFAGPGLFVLQETASSGAAAAAGRFWTGLWNGVLKVFGL